MQAEYSTTVNPTAPWTYGRKFTVESPTVDVLNVRWGSTGWYLGNFGHGAPSIQLGPVAADIQAGPGLVLWAKNNSNGYPVVRWTSPNAGYYAITGKFVGGDIRGVDTRVYVVVNGSTQFAGAVIGYEAEQPFALNDVYVAQGSYVDFVVVWNGGGSSEASWTSLIGAIVETRALLTCGDDDGDGEVNGTDRCPGTPPGEVVDDSGCSRAQFCATFNATTTRGAKECRAADWKNDEPLLRAKGNGNCTVDKGANRGRADDTCVRR